MAHASALEKIPPSAGAYALSAAIVAFPLGYMIGRGRALGLLASHSPPPPAGGPTDSPSVSSSEHEDDDDDDDDEAAVPADSAEECKLVLVVRSDLGMTKGKIAAQCGHATLACYTALLRADANHPVLKQWQATGQAKVALKVDGEEDMLTLQARAVSLGLCARVIHDAGRTQIASGSATVLGIGPAPKSQVDQVTAHLKLL